MLKELKDLVGAKILTFIGKAGDEEIIIQTDKGDVKLWHCQDCCEYVYVEDINGEVDDIIEGEIIKFEERSNKDGEPADKEPEWGDITQYTFYELQTTRGDINIRFCGSSNGYYSVGVDISFDNGDGFKKNWGL